MTNPERTIEKLADEIIAGLDASYELVYVDYRDQMTEEQIAAVVRNDIEKFWELTTDFESDQRWEATSEIIKREGQIILDSWAAADDEDYDHLLDELEHDDNRDRIREEIEERDVSDWPKDLAANSGSVLLRIPIAELDEDHAYYREQVTPADVLTQLNLPINDHNLDVVQDALNEASPEFSLLMGYWVVGATVSDLWELDGDCDKVTIKDPHLYLGNPFAGSGWVTEKPIQATITVGRDELRTDKDAFGYSLDNVYGGLNPSAFEAEIRPAV